MKQGVKWPSMPYEEYRLRIDKAKEILPKHGLDAMFLFSPTNWWYYGGWTDVCQMHCDAWRAAMIICPDHDPIVIAHAIYTSSEIAFTSWVEDVRPWSGAAGRHWGAMPTAFWPLVFDTLDELGLSDKTLGVETGPDIDTYLSFDEYKAMIERLPKAKIMSADKAIWEQRMVKSPYEIAIIREGCRRACMAVREAFEAIRPGVNELDVHRVFWESCAKLGLLEAPNVSTWVCYFNDPKELGGRGRNCMRPVDHIIQLGDQGLTDLGPTYKGYQMDFQRNVCVGDPPEKWLKLSNISEEVHLETLESIKPGIQVRDIIKVAHKAQRKRDPNWAPRIDFAGHGMGLSNHEPPWIRANEETIVVPGMALCIEAGPNPDSEGEVCPVHPEDIVVVTEDGVDNLTRYLPYMWIAK